MGAAAPNSGRSSAPTSNNQPTFYLNRLSASTVNSLTAADAIAGLGVLLGFYLDGQSSELFAMKDTGKQPAKEGIGHARSNMGIGAAAQSAAFLLKQIEADKYQANLIPSFIAALVSKLEGRINEVVIDYFYHKCGAGYRSFAKMVLGLPFKERLVFAPALLSDYHFVLNEAHPDLQVVYRLIDLRNTLLHVKPHWHPATLTEDAIEYANPATLDPYAKVAGLYEFPRDDLRRYDVVAHSLFMAFSRLPYRISKRRFQPAPWFKEVKPRKFKRPRRRSLQRKKP